MTVLALACVGRVSNPYTSQVVLFNFLTLSGAYGEPKLTNPFCGGNSTKSVVAMIVLDAIIYADFHRMIVVTSDALATFKFCSVVDIAQVKPLENNAPPKPKSVVSKLNFSFGART